MLMVVCLEHYWHIKHQVVEIFLVFINIELLFCFYVLWFIMTVLSPRFGCKCIVLGWVLSPYFYFLAVFSVALLLWVFRSQSIRFCFVSMCYGL